MPLYSQIFQATISGNRALAQTLELERMQLIENGAPGFITPSPELLPNSHAGRHYREKKEARERNDFTAQLQILQQAFQELEHSKQLFDQRMAEFHERLNQHIEEIDHTLTAGSESLTAQERQALEERRLELLRLQQQAYDEQSRLQEAYQDVHERHSAGERVDPDELKALSQDMEEVMDRLEAEIDISPPNTEPEHTPQGHINFTPTNLSF